jgi:phospholipid/cholesterol/gamma-HCH transport system permease protein
LNLGLEAFYTQVVNALVLKDIITGLVKSVIFAWIIVLVGAFYGFRVKGGAESVGRTTTAAVVTSIFMVILADSILGLIFYFGQGMNY